MSNELNLCPFCGGEVETDDDDFRTFFCSKCGAGATFLKMFEDGEFRHATKEESLSAWNRRTPSDHIVDANKKVDNNPPLTLEKLKGRTNPVWLVISDCSWIPEGGYYCLLDCAVIVTPSGHRFGVDECLRRGWVFLDRKPEEE